MNLAEGWRAPVVPTDGVDEEGDYWHFRFEQIELMQLMHWMMVLVACGAMRQTRWRVAQETTQTETVTPT